MKNEFYYVKPNYVSKDWEAIKNIARVVLESEAKPEPPLFVNGKFNPDYKRWIKEESYKQVDPAIGMTKRIVSKLPKGVKNIVKSKYVKGIEDSDLFEHVAKKGLDSAIYDYSDEMYKHINKKLRAGEKLQPDESEILKLFTIPGNYSGTSIRAAYLPQESLDKLQVDEIVKSRGILSTSDHPIEMSDDLFMLVNSTQKSEGKVPVILSFDNLGRPQYKIKEFTKFPKENEVLINPNTAYSVTSVEKFNGTPVINLKAIPDELGKYFDHRALPLLGTGGLLYMEDDDD